MTLDDHYDIPATVLARQLTGETVILDLDRGTYFGLNAVGTRIWELLEQGQTLRRICDGLAEEYEVAPAHLEHDVLALVAELLARGLVAPA